MSTTTAPGGGSSVNNPRGAADTHSPPVTQQPQQEPQTTPEARLWLPEPDTLDLPPPEYAYTSGGTSSPAQDICFFSLNVNGGMLDRPRQGLPTKLQRILHAAACMGVDYILLQDTRVPASMAAYFEHLCRPWRAWISPMPDGAAAGGCITLARGHWARRDHSYALLPDGRGLITEVRGAESKRLATVNVYCWAGAADEPLSAKMDPLSAYAKNVDLLDLVASILAPAIRRNRFVVAGGDFNMHWDATRDRAAPADDGDLAAQAVLHRFADECKLTPGLDATTQGRRLARPATYKVGTPQASRLDYIFLPRYHQGALRLQATLAPRQFDTDHSGIIMAVTRKAALGSMTGDLDRHHRYYHDRQAKPFLSAKEAGTAWTDATAARSSDANRIADALENILDEGPRQGQSAQGLACRYWHSFVHLGIGIGKKLRPSHYDTRPPKPRWSRNIATASRRQDVYGKILRAYEVAGCRPTPTVLTVRNAQLLPEDLHPPPVTRPTYQDAPDHLADWKSWYERMTTAAKDLNVSIKRERTRLGVQHAKSRRTQAMADWRNGDKQRDAYNITFRDQAGSATAAAGAYAAPDDDPDGEPVWHTDPDKVKEIQRRYFAGLVALSPWNRPPDDPLAAPKPHLPQDLADIMAQTKAARYDALTQYVSEDRFLELLSTANYDSAPGASGLSYALLALSHPSFHRIIRALINIALKYGVIPRAWSQGLLYPLQKDPAQGADLKNLRPITLLETPLKLLTMHMNVAIHDSWDTNPVLQPIQHGFLRGIGTQQALAIVTSLYEQRYHEKLPTHVAYLDLAAAFCAVPHWAITNALRRLNIPPLGCLSDVGDRQSRLHQRHHALRSLHELPRDDWGATRRHTLTAEVHSMAGSPPGMATLLSLGHHPRQPGHPRSGLCRRPLVSRSVKAGPANQTRQSVSVPTVPRGPLQRGEVAL